MIRVGCAPYLNSLPLVETLDPAQVRWAPPRELSELDRAGELDVALLPVAELFGRPELSWVPGIAVGSRDHTHSVRLHLRRPIAEVRTIAVDPHSRSSNALLRVLAQRRWRIAPRWVSDASGADAFLTIGDPTFTTRSEHSLDLGAEWWALTGKPFVYALWTHRADHPRRDAIAALLGRAKEAGLAWRPEIARREGPPRGLTAEQALVYLTESIRYDLGPRELEGLELFRTWSTQLQPA